jgi:DNA-binding NtrC family response regulator
MIFVVDDDARIRTATAAALRTEGHQVQDFESAVDALAALPEAPTLRLIVSDVQMPIMSGPDFVRSALLHRPDLKIHYMSGDIGEIPFEMLAPWPLLAKPFTAKVLIKAVAESLA